MRNQRLLLLQILDVICWSFDGLSMGLQEILGSDVDILPAYILVVKPELLSNTTRNSQEDAPNEYSHSHTGKQGVKSEAKYEG